MPNTIPAEGTTLEFSTDGGTVWTGITPLVSITPPEAQIASVERPDLAATAKKRRPSKIADHQELEFSFERDPNDAGHIALLATLKTVVRWRISYNTGQATPARDTFDGFITSFSPTDMEEESNHAVDVTVQVTGDVTRTVGA